MNIIISIEATSDLTKKQVEENDLHVIDMDFFIDGQEFNTKNESVSSSKLYEKMRLGSKTSTSQINQSVYENFFTNLLTNFPDNPILHLAFSSGLSETFEQAKAAASIINDKNKKVYVIDSLCACSGQGLFAILVKRKAKECESIEELIDYAQNLKVKICHVFTVDNLKYLANGGRIKNSSKIIGNILNIKPVMKVDEKGRLAPFKKVISRKKVLNTICEYIKSNLDNSFNDCFVAHADCLGDATLVQSKLLDETILKPVIVNLGPIIGCHSGPGTLAVFFVSK